MSTKYLLLLLLFVSPLLVPTTANCQPSDVVVYRGYFDELRFARTPDVHAPRVERSGECTSSMSFTVTDMPEDMTIRSNLSSIDLIVGSRNMAIDVDPFEAGVDLSATYRLRAIDPWQPAVGMVQIYDKAGNVAYDTLVHTPYDLELSSEILPFGLYRIGDTVLQQLTVRNRSARPAIVAAEWLTVRQRRFELLAQDDTIRLATGDSAGSSAVLTLRFIAREAGSFADTLVLDVCGQRYRAYLSAAAGTPMVSAIDHNFGPWPTNATTPAYADLRIANTSTEPSSLTISGLRGPFGDDPAFAVIDPPAFPLVLREGEALALRVRFQPRQVAIYVDSIIVEHDAPSGDDTMILSGLGIEAALVVVRPLDFGRKRVGSGPHRDSLTLKSVGTAPLTLRTPLLLEGDRNDFRVTNTSELTNRVLFPGEEQSVVIEFTPTASGVRRLTITFEFDPPSREAVSTVVTGIGESSTGILDETAVDRSPITPNPAAAGARVSVEVDGAATLRVVDLLGVTRLERSTGEAGRVELDLAGLAPGLHFVVITVAGRTRTERLIVVP